MSYLTKLKILIIESRSELVRASVIIYTYQRKHFILKALKSVLSQSIQRKDYEIIVVKAFKDEDIDAEIDKYADINIYINEKSHGKKLVPAILVSRGDIIFILDDDDEYLPKKMEVVLNLFFRNPALVFVHHSMVKVDSSGKVLENWQEATPENYLWMDTLNYSRNDLSSFLRYRANWYSSCMAFKKESLIPFLSYLEQVNQSVDPFLFFMALCSKGKMIIIPDRLSLYRVHDSTTNFLEGYDKYIEKRLEFYRNTLSVYTLAKEMSRDLPSESFVTASIVNMELIIGFLTKKSEKRELFKLIWNSAATLRIAITKYNIMWLFFSSIKFLIGNFAIRAYYLYNMEQIKHMHKYH